MLSDQLFDLVIGLVARFREEHRDSIVLEFVFQFWRGINGIEDDDAALSLFRGKTGSDHHQQFVTLSMKVTLRIFCARQSGRMEQVVTVDDEIRSRSHDSQT